jgi:hypothetical protein
MLSKQELSNTSSLSPDYISQQVKQAILIVYGLDHPVPDSLADSALMSGFGFNDYQWIELAFSLTKIIRNYNPGQSVTAPELENMVTVRDYIDLVIQKSGI